MNAATVAYIAEVTQRLDDLGCLMARAEGICNRAQRQRVINDLYRRQDALLEELQLLHEGSDEDEPEL